MDVVEPLTTVDPRKKPDEKFEYIDVSSVSRSTFMVQDTSILLGQDAPSRAKRLVQTGDVLFATIRPTLQRISVIPDHLNGSVCSTGYFVLRPKPHVFSRYLFHYLFSQPFYDEMAILERGASYPAVSDGDVKNHLMLLPPLPEQKRIVAILDEAFAAIATATANTEKNIKNAEELGVATTRSLLAESDVDWSNTTIGEQLLLQRGFDITKKQQKPGSVPVVSSGGIKSYHSEAKVRGPGVVIGRKGSIGSVHFVENDYWPHDTTLWVKDFKGNNPRFAFHFFTAMDLAKLDTGTANPALNRNLIHPTSVIWPPTKAQKAIVKRIDDVLATANSLAAAYSAKLTHLATLKQSILHKAFTGELTADPKAADSTLKEAGV